MAAELLDAFAGGESAPYAFGAEDLRDLLLIQRRALAALHAKRTRQIRALAEALDRERAARERLERESRHPFRKLLGMLRKTENRK